MAKYFVDVESTGVDLVNDRVIQLALIIDDDKALKHFSDLCYTEAKMSFSAMGVHHITPEMLEDKYWPDETDTFLALSDGNDEQNYFISHGNELDLVMLKHEGFECKMKLIDTNQCAKHLLKDAEDYKLQTLRYQYGLYKKEQNIAEKMGLQSIKAHDALGDAILHYLLFELLLERVSGDINELVKLTKEDILLESVPFGKYKDKMTFEELFKENPNYLVWIYANMNMWSDLEHTVKHWLKKNPTLWKKAQEDRRLKMR